MILERVNYLLYLMVCHPHRQKCDECVLGFVTKTLNINNHPTKSSSGLFLNCTVTISTNKLKIGYVPCFSSLDCKSVL